MGHVRASADDAQQTFTLLLIAEDAVELHLDDGEVLTAKIDSIGGHEIAEAIERQLGLSVQFDYSKSRLTWSGGLRPLVEQTGRLKTRRTRRHQRMLR